MNTTSQLLQKSKWIDHLTSVESRAPRRSDLRASRLSAEIEASALVSIHESIQRYVQNLEIGIHKGSVVVSGKARSYHDRQLAEQKALLIASELLKKRLVSEVAVCRL